MTDEERFQSNLDNYTKRGALLFSNGSDLIRPYTIETSAQRFDYFTKEESKTFVDGKLNESLDFTTLVDLESWIMEISFNRPTRAATPSITNWGTDFTYKSLFKTLANQHYLRGNQLLTGSGEGADGSLADQRQYVFIPELAVKQLTF